MEEQVKRSSFFKPEIHWWKEKDQHPALKI
jgi:hypothetical protein